MASKLLFAAALAALLSAAAPSWANDPYIVDCSQASQADWAQCIIDRMGENEGDE